MQKILFEQTTKPGTGTFQIRERDTSGMPGHQDNFMMFVIHPNVDCLYPSIRYSTLIGPHAPIEYDLGSHPSLEGAKKFARNRGLI